MRIEQPNNRVGHSRRTAQRINNGDKPVSQPGLAQITEECAQQRHFSQIKTEFNHQLVKAVILGRAFKNARNGALDSARCSNDCCSIAAHRCFKHKFLDMAERTAANRG